MTTQILIAGFGGQGVLFAGKFITYKGLLEGKNVSWLPSYGPEMRGGTANCHVIIDDNPIGSPIVTNPDILIVMNRPSLDKFESAVTKDGYVFVDSSLVDREVKRDDVKCVYINATEIADGIGNKGLANMVMLGAVLKKTEVFTLEEIEETMKKSLPASKLSLVEANMKAVNEGYKLV